MTWIRMIDEMMMRINFGKIKEVSDKIITDAVVKSLILFIERLFFVYKIS